MKSSILRNLNTILFVLIISLVSRNTFAKIDQDESLIRHNFSNAVSLSRDNWSLTVSRGTQRIVTLKKGNLDVTIYKRDGLTLYEMTLFARENMYEVAVKGRKVGVIVTNRDTMYNEDACLTNSDPFKPFKNQELIQKVEDLAFSDEFFGGTCSKLSDDSKGDLQGIMAQELSPSTSSLVKCLNSDSFAKNTSLQVTANKIITRYIDELKKIESGKSDLKIECAEGDRAKYDPKRTALIYPTKGTKLSKDGCKTGGQVFAHEFFHHSGLSEVETAAIDSQCFAACKKKIQLAIADNRGVLVTSALKSAHAAETKTIQEKIAPTLQAEIKTAEFIPVQDSDIQEITNPTSSGAYQASVDRVYNSMSSNMEKMAAPLNRAIASTVTTARAEKSASSTTSERSISKTTIAGLRQPASAKSNGNEEYVVEEILADKYNVPVSEVRAAAVAAGVSAPGSGTTQTVATRSARSPATAAPGPGGNEIAGGGAGPGGGQASTASAGGSSSTAGGVPGRSVSSGARGNSRLPASSGSQAAGTDPLVEQLGQFNEVRGRRYQQIQERYDDPTFEPELKAKNIAIEYRRNNKTTIIGETSNSSSRTLFRDDGTVLKKISGAK